MDARRNIENQQALAVAERFDKAGLRTVGVLTKSDQVNDDAEHASVSRRLHFQEASELADSSSFYA